MSSVVWDQNNLFQKVGTNIEELGHVKYDDNSGEYVLWLKDTRNVFASNRGYIRGDSFPSMEEAKSRAAACASARLFHYMWLVGLRDSGKYTGTSLTQSIEDAENCKPLTVSTFKKEMKKATRQQWKFCALGFVLGFVTEIAVGLLI